MRRALALASLIVACRGGTPPGPSDTSVSVSPAPTASGASSAGLVAAPAPSTSSTAASSTPAPDREPEPFTVILTKTSLLAGEQSEAVAAITEPRARGFDAKYKRADAGANDLLIVPLRAVATRWRDFDRQRQRDAGKTELAWSEAVIIAEPTTPQRLVMEVLYTLGQSEFARFHFMVLQQAKRDGGASKPNVAAPATAPALAPLPATIGAAGKSLDLHVHIDARGIAVSTSGGAIGAGCKGLGAGVTIPQRGGAQDVAMLTACARAIKSARPDYADESSVVINGADDVEYGTIIQVMDALRGESEKRLFPEVTFGVEPKRKP